MASNSCSLIRTMRLPCLLQIKKQEIYNFVQHNSTPKVIESTFGVLFTLCAKKNDVFSH